MWVELTEHFADDTGTLLGWLVVGIANLLHAVKNTAVNRLKAIAHVWQCTCHDDRHRIVDIVGAHLFVDVHLDDSIVLLLINFFHLILLGCHLTARTFILYLGAKIHNFRECSKQKRRNLRFRAPNFDFRVNFDPLSKELFG